MKRVCRITGIAYGVVLVLLISACTGKKPVQQVENTTPPVKETPVTLSPETNLLLKNLTDQGDYVNTRQFPSLIKPSLVYDNLTKNQLIIDLRDPAGFKAGHIKGAVNEQFGDLPAYFEKRIKPFQYDKIVLVSQDGQIASYTTCLLRLMGYGNVYAMRWGMSGWNPKFAQAGWLKSVSGQFENQLETKDNPAPPATGMPDLHTGDTTGEAVGAARFAKLFEEGTGNVLIDAKDVFADPSKYYIINYDRKDKYLDGHIPGAVRYTPGETLGIVNEMATIPHDKPVVVYCATGHNSGFVTAYLRLFGYDARTLAFGNNGFMFNKMVTERKALSWLPFTKEEVHDYPVVR